MDDCLGRLVVSSAGRDKGCICVIVGLSDDNEFAYIADGKLRKVEKPKKKKLRHIKPVNWVSEENRMTFADKLTNRFIREAVAKIGEIPDDFPL